MSNHLNVVKNQFNKQAEKFNNWSVTRNSEYLQGFYDFCGISADDTLLDIACGTGDWALFCAKKIKHVYGIDISSNMLELAKNKADECNLSNILFKEGDVCNINTNNNFSLITCRSAFHHFTNYINVFIEMKRLCSNGGKIAIQDIVTYKDYKVNEYFESFEKLVDKSHYSTLDEEQFISLFEINNIRIDKTARIEVELSVPEYISHASQSNETREQIIKTIEFGLNDQVIANYFSQKDKDLFFKREIILILGSVQ
jgi:ubiquinone/menaquinone biosynthesis C-methylase UbiE